MIITIVVSLIIGFVIGFLFGFYIAFMSGGFADGYKEGAQDASHTAWEGIKAMNDDIKKFGVSTIIDNDAPLFGLKKLANQFIDRSEYFNSERCLQKTCKEIDLEAFYAVKEDKENNKNECNT